ncbi:efflux RND transporter permease subunit [Massilia niabensis]|uniref:RND family transporter n=1 Tax=Massilia niabensis TaxID=544910 RepID=A0ABW0LEC2_9BURK
MFSEKESSAPEMAVIKDLKDFDRYSGNWLERLVFNNRLWMVLACALLTVFFALQIPKLQVSASFEKSLPTSHPYIVNYQENRSALRGLGDSVRVVVENTEGDIFNAAYLDSLAKINDEIVLLPGVDRSWLKSIWTPVVRWTEYTEEGFVGGPVMPQNYNGSPETIQALKLNINRAGVVGSLVANDFKSSMIVVPLMSRDAEGRPADYHALSKSLEDIRSRYESAGKPGSPKLKVHVVGYAKLVGDLIDGLQKVMTFFVASAVIAAFIIFMFTRCVRSTLTVLACSIIAVTWQLGLLVTMGFALDPFSALVPFLIFAIGVSHGAQKMNGIMQDVGRGTHTLVAARYTFRRLFIAGVTALLADAVGFAVLMLIDIPAIRDLALAASMGVAVLIFTNLLLLPVMLSFTGVSRKAALRSLRDEEEQESGKGLGAVWRLLDRFTERRWATAAVLVSLGLAVGGYIVALNLQTGDLDPGAPELRPEARYNLDDAYISANYGLSSEVFAVMVKTPPDDCRKFDTLVEIDRLAFALSQVPGVQKTASLADTVRNYTSGGFEGNPKWLTISGNQGLIDPQISNALAWNSEFITDACALTPVVAYLSDHKADTLNRVMAAAEKFAAEHSTPDRQFLLAAGNAGIQAITNIVVKKANVSMLIYVYAAVIVLCAIAFRSWRAVLVAVLPLMLTSILAEALMVMLGIGVKVATLPVIALGVGIGVDYSLYLLSVQMALMRKGESLSDAYRHAVQFTGKVVALVGVTLGAGVVTWAWSPIRFQADMGILLTFMFIVNMIGSLILVPALSYFLFKEPRAKDRQAVPAAAGDAVAGSGRRGAGAPSAVAR